MAKKFIHYESKNGIEYASVYTPQKIKGKKVNNPEYLGRVIDKDHGVFKSREKGLFTYSLENGYDTLKPDIDSDTQSFIIQEEKLILDFGDAYCLYTVLKSSFLNDIIQEIVPNQADTLMTLIGYKLLAGGANRYAEDWWSGSYARIMFPQVKISSQRISEFYSQLGDESVQRKFFNYYLNALCVNKKTGVLIDSTGLPNDIHFPLTAINTHNGVTSNEARLIFVIDRLTGMPLFFRYNAGNIVDVSTLKSTIAELDAYGIKTDYAILDAGYYSEDNINALYGYGDDGKKIPFITRLRPNLKLYKQLVYDHAKDLAESSRYWVIQRNRLLSIKCVEIFPFGNKAYAYVAIDHDRRHDESIRYAKDALGNKELSFDSMDEAVMAKGLFILISSEEIETKDIMPLYYTRQCVEQVFDIAKNNADLLPLRTHNEDTFRGHLLIAFIVSVVYLLVNQKLEGSAYNTEGAFRILRNQKCKVFVDRLLPKEPDKKMNDIYKILRINPPHFIPLARW